MSFQVGGYNPYGGYGGYGQYRPTYPPQFPTYPQPQPQPSVPAFGMQDMMQMFMMLMMQLLQKKQTPTTIDGAKGPSPEGIAGGYGRNAAINLMNAGVPDGVSVKYTDDPNNLDNVFAFSKKMTSAIDFNGDGNVTADEFLASGMDSESAGKTMALHDRNRDGVIDLAENTAITLTKDVNHDGVISAQEQEDYATLVNEHPDQAGEAIDKALADNKLEDAVKKFGQNLIFSGESILFDKEDKNDDGLITPEEQLAYARSKGNYSYTLDQAKKDIAANDVDGDGKNSLLENVGTRVSWDTNKDWDPSDREVLSGITTERTGSADYVLELTKKAIEERDLANLLKAWQDANKSD